MLWDTSSKSQWLRWLGVGTVAVLAPYPGHTKVFLSQEKALSIAFPAADEIKRKTLFLNDEQVRRVESRARVALPSRVITYYEGHKSGATMGRVFFDTRVIRTFPATVMIKTESDRQLGFVEMVSFFEPEDYLPRTAWWDLFRGKKLHADLRLRRDIPNVAGATLTAQAVTDSVRLHLALLEEL